MNILLVILGAIFVICAIPLLIQLAINVVLLAFRLLFSFIGLYLWFVLILIGLLVMFGGK